MGPQAETKLVTEVHINPCVHRTNAQLHQTHGYTRSNCKPNMLCQLDREQVDSFTSWGMSNCRAALDCAKTQFSVTSTSKTVIVGIMCQSIVFSGPIHAYG